MQRFKVAEFGIEECRGPTQIGPLPVVRPSDGGQRTIESEGVRFGLASRDERSLALVDAIWGKDAINASGEEENRLVCTPVPGMSGRYVDPESGWQLLSFEYAPFTLIKQALRWEYGRQSPATGLVPVHGVILEASGRRVSISARGQAGKSFLADTWLEADQMARVLVDDWSLLEVGTRRIRRTGDTALHVRGTAFTRRSAQLDGAAPVLVELCDSDRNSDETRYLVDRSCLRRFENSAVERTLDAMVLVRDPRADGFELRDDAASVAQAFEAEVGTFWDDSLAGLPAPAVLYLREAWQSLLGSVPVLVMRGHRQLDAGQVVRALREALEM
jgi:hypothetical protein